jgi:hypothetical protein
MDIRSLDGALSADQDRLASEGLNPQPSITAGIVGLAILIALFFASVLVDRSFLGYVASLRDRGSEWLFSRLAVTVPSCPDPGGSWWLQGTLLCTK